MIVEVARRRFVATVDVVGHGSRCGHGRRRGRGHRRGSGSAAVAMVNGWQGVRAGEGERRGGGE